MEQIAIPPSDDEARENSQRIAKLHPGNRFRLMFGMPMLPQPEYDAMTPEQRLHYDRNNPSNQH